MAATTLVEVQNQIQKKWSPLFGKELREQTLLPGLVNKQYDGEIKFLGDTVKISQLNAPTGELRTVGTDADVFDSQQMSWSQVNLVADKRAVASYEVQDLAQIQSQLGSPEGQSEMRDAMRFAIEKQINDYLWSLTSPSTSSPDHLINSTATFDATVLQSCRTLAAKAKWMQDNRWYGLLNPDYYGNILAAQTMTSKDYVGDEAPVIAGQIANKRFGFNLLEDNSRSSAKGLLFHPDYMLLAMQTEPQFKISDLHPQKKFGYLISVDVIFGAKLGIDGGKKHIYVTAAASGIDYNA